jgi:hypothetical protein
VLGAIIITRTIAWLMRGTGARAAAFTAPIRASHRWDVWLGGAAESDDSCRKRMGNTSPGRGYFGPRSAPSPTSRVSSIEISFNHPRFSLQARSYTSYRFQNGGLAPNRSQLG